MNQTFSTKLNLLARIQSLQEQIVDETKWLRRFERSGEIEAVQAHKRTIEDLGNRLDNLESLLASQDAQT